MKGTKGPTKKQEDLQESVSVDKYIDQVHRSSHRY